MVISSGHCLLSELVKPHCNDQVGGVQKLFSDLVRLIKGLRVAE